MTAYNLGARSPSFGDSVWIAPDANVIGTVTLGVNVGVWFGAVLRGDNELIEIGDDTNLQEHTIVHTDPGFPVSVGKGCNNSLIGMGAIILNGARIGNNCLVGAGALVTEGKSFPDGSLIIGSPAKAARELDEKTIEGLRASARNYAANAKRFRDELRRI